MPARLVSTSNFLVELIRSFAPPVSCARNFAELGNPMAYKFHVGETVTMTPATSRNVPGGVYEVVKHLPDNNCGESQYRIKSAREPHERVARESELTKA